MKEVICIESFSGNYTGPDNIDPKLFPKEGEVFKVIDTVKFKQKTFYYLKEYGMDAVFNSDQFADITRLGNEIEMALKKPFSEVDLRPLIDDCDDDTPNWIKRFNDL